MKLTFLKVNVQQVEGGFVVDIAPGALRFEAKAGEVVLAEPLKLQMTSEGQFVNILRYVNFEVFIGQGLSNQVMQGSVFSLVTHQDFEPALYKAMRECRVVPFMQRVDERALFAAEYERMYSELLVN